MKPDPDPHEQLRQLIDRTLRDQPPLPAPHSLEERVLAAVTRARSTPWWRRGFLHWPQALRLAFLVASVGFVRIGLLAWERIASTLGEVESSGIREMAPGISWAGTAADLLTALNEVLRALTVSIPESWVYGGGAVLLSLYAVLFGLGAVGYRVFRPGSLPRHTP